MIAPPAPRAAAGVGLVMPPRIEPSTAMISTSGGKTTRSSSLRASQPGRESHAVERQQKRHQQHEESRAGCGGRRDEQDVAQKCQHDTRTADDERPRWRRRRRAPRDGKNQTEQRDRDQDAGADRRRVLRARPAGRSRALPRVGACSSTAPPEASISACCATALSHLSCPWSSIIASRHLSETFVRSDAPADASSKPADVERLAAGEAERPQSECADKDQPRARRETRSRPLTG